MQTSLLLNLFVCRSNTRDSVHCIKDSFPFGHVWYVVICTQHGLLMHPWLITQLPVPYWDNSIISSLGTLVSNVLARIRGNTGSGWHWKFLIFFYYAIIISF